MGALSIQSGSTLRLGVGANITALGTVTLSSAAIYRATGVGSSSGTATITGASINIADGGTSISQTDTQLLYTSTFTFTAGSNTATLTIAAKPLGTLLGGGNGAGLDAARQSAATGSSVRSLFDTLYRSSDLARIQSGVQQTAGEGVVNGAQVVLGQSQMFHAAVGQQMGSFSSGGSSLALDASGGLWSTAKQAGLAGMGGSGVGETLAQLLAMNVAAPNAANLGTLGGKGQVQWIHQGARRGMSGYNAAMGLAALGYDAPVAENARLGVSFGFSGGESKGAGVTQNLKTWFGSLYGTLGLGPIVLDGSLAYGRTNGDLKGSYSFPVATTTSGHYHADTFSGMLKASHAFLFNDGATTLKPSLGLEAATSTRGAFTESGTGLTKRFSSATMNTVAVPVGASLSHDVGMGKSTLTPELSVYYVRQLADTQSSGRMTLLDSTTATATGGADPGADLLRANLGARADLGQGLALSLFYNGEFGNSYQNNGVSIEAKYSF